MARIVPIALLLCVSILSAGPAAAGPVEDACRPLPPRYVTVEAQHEPPGFRITWDEPLAAGVTGIDGYRIYRALNDTMVHPYEAIADVPADARDFFDPQPDGDPKADYVYGVSAFNGCGESSMSIPGSTYPPCDVIEPTDDPNKPGGIDIAVHEECVVAPRRP